MSTEFKDALSATAGAMSRLQTKLPEEVSRLLTMDTAGERLVQQARAFLQEKEETVRCSCCKMVKTASDCYANGRCKACHSEAMRRWYLGNRAGILAGQRVENAIRCATKWVGKLVIDGECLVCGEKDFHAKDCRAALLLETLREMA